MCRISSTASARRSTSRLGCLQKTLSSLIFAKIVQVFDSWAGELSRTSFNEFALPYLSQIAEKLPLRLSQLNCERVPMIVFAKGAWYALEVLCQSKYDVIGLDWLHDPGEAFKVAQRFGKTIQGNADPGILYGDEDTISAEVQNMVAGFNGGKKGWIANLGHGKVNAFSSRYSPVLKACRSDPFRQPRYVKVLL